MFHLCCSNKQGTTPRTSCFEVLFTSTSYSGGGRRKGDGTLFPLVFNSLVSYLGFWLSVASSPAVAMALLNMFLPIFHQACGSPVYPCWMWKAVSASSPVLWIWAGAFMCPCVAIEVMVFFSMLFAVVVLRATSGLG